MYNKLFTKILDSSIWMEPTPTRIVWLTLIAAMDEDGFVPFASIHNLAHRALVSVPEAQQAVEVLESPDVNSSDPDNEGRRIERVTGGWIVRNSQKYRELSTRDKLKEQTRKRVAAHRERVRNAKCNASVTTSEADTHTEAKSESEKGKKERAGQAPQKGAQKGKPDREEVVKFWNSHAPKTEESMKAAKAWWENNSRRGWKTEDGDPIRDWRRALRAYIDAFASVPEESKVRAWADGELIPSDVVDSWIQTCNRNEWKLLNDQTGELEPMRDWRAALRGFSAKADPYGSR